MSRIAVFSIVLFSTGGSAETLLLHNGTAVSGKLQSMDQQEVRIERCGRVEQYVRGEVKSISFESGDGGAACGVASKVPFELPAGVSIQLRLLDHIDSDREPSGQVFRAVVEGPVKLDGRIAVSNGAQAILRMVRTGSPASHPTLDLVGIQLSKRWAKIEPLPASGLPLAPVPGFFSTMSLADVPSPDTAAGKILIREDRLVAPPNTRLNFVLKQAVRLQLEGS